MISPVEHEYDSYDLEEPTESAGTILEDEDVNGVLEKTDGSYNHNSHYEARVKREPIVDAHLAAVEDPLASEPGAQITNELETGDADKDPKMRKWSAMLAGSRTQADRPAVCMWLRRVNALKKQYHRAQQDRDQLVKENAGLALRDAAHLKVEMLQTRLISLSWPPRASHPRLYRGQSDHDDMALSNRLLLRMVLAYVWDGDCGMTGLFR
ncbi:hypothetical protein PG984_007755 [Apiospora sp. TS-2023a]